MTLIKILLKKFFTLEYLTVIWQYKTEWEKYKKIQNIDGVSYSAWKLAWQVGCRMRSCQEIKYVFGEYYFASLNIIVMGWNFGASNRIRTITLMLFLWDNALQKLNLKYLHILQSECKLLIHTLTQIGI